jgi:hypothetical protein
MLQSGILRGSARRVELSAEGVITIVLKCNVITSIT